MIQPPDMRDVVRRWSGLGPYYAMFPTDFAFEVVDRYCPPGGTVLDPFAGRGTSIFAAATSRRNGVGIEINPVGWIYGHVKLNPANHADVLNRLDALRSTFDPSHEEYLNQLPPFFTHCYSRSVLEFLVVARAELEWKSSPVDATLMAITLVYLHGKRGQSLSNQMRQGKALSPDYSVRWWTERRLSPPDLDPYTFLEQRIQWRYAKGTLSGSDSLIIHGDATQEVSRVSEHYFQSHFDLLFTSPPYWNVTNYNYDQWLRLWMLGFECTPVKNRGVWHNKFENKSRYAELLESVFAACAQVLKPNATIYVRTDRRDFTFETTLEKMRSAFPGKNEQIIMRPFLRKTQTHLFGDRSTKPGEVDIIFTG